MDNPGLTLGIKPVKGSWLGLRPRPKEGPGPDLGMRLVVKQTLDLRIRPMEEGPGLTVEARLVEVLG